MVNALIEIVKWTCILWALGLTAVGSWIIVVEVRRRQAAGEW